MTIQIDGKMTVRDLVGRYPQTRPVFEKHGIDYCCGGGKCLADVANEHGLKLPALVDALGKTLQAEPGKAEATDKDWYAAPLGELVSHIVETHHGYMKTALPRLQFAGANGAQGPRGAPRRRAAPGARPLQSPGCGTQQSPDEGGAGAIPLHRGR